MARSFDNFRFKILDKQFFRKDGFITSKTVHVTLFNKDGKEIDEMFLGYPNLIDIYDAIGEDIAVNLDECFIEGFSLTACRRYLLKPKTELLKINSFTAKNAFFFSQYDIDFSYTEFNGNELNFTGTTFVGANLNYSHSVFNNQAVLFNDQFVFVEKYDMSQCKFFSTNLNFKNSIFEEGEKDFQDTNFGEGEVVFINTQFGDGNVSFINTQFNNSNVSFKVARFGEGKEDFRFAKFGSGKISFDQTDFGPGRIDFRNVEFGKGRTSFNRCVFSEGEVTFEGAEVNNGKITFLRSTFGAKLVSFELFQGFDADMTFEKVIFPGNVNFSNGIFKKLTFNLCQFNGTVNLHVESATEIDLYGCIARDIIDYYSHGESPKVEILNINGLRLLGKLYVQWDANCLKEKIYKQTNSTIGEKAAQFRILKENFNGLGRYEDEDKAYVEYMRCVQKDCLEKDIERSFLSKTIAYPKFFFKTLIFDKMGLYATSPSRVITSIIIVQLIFSVLYTGFALTGIGDVISNLQTEPPVFFKSMYFCVITFFTIGYGEFIPLGYSRVLSGILGFLGVFLMSYFTVAFVRKILR
ncbi:MAG: potassium channel family protein [Bacteroidales bacterium]